MEAKGGAVLWRFRRVDDGFVSKVPLYDPVTPLERILVFIDFICVGVRHLESVASDKILEFRPAVFRLLRIPKVKKRIAQSA